MKIFRIIRKSFKDAFRSIFRNISLSMASVSCSAITLILVAIALLVTYNVNSITRDIEEVLTIVVFVDKEATDEQVASVETAINSLKNVDASKTEYDSKEEIKDSLRKDEDIKPILDVLEDNPISSSYIVHVKDVKDITETAEEIKDIQYVTKVKYGESLVNKMLSMFDVIRIVCIIAVVVLLFVTGFLISNTIKITIFSRRHEIDIMRLVGTSNTVVRLPFLIEGFVLGLIGAIIPVLLTIYGYTFLYDFIGGKIFTNLIILVEPKEIIYSASLVVVIVGALVGMFGSTRAVRRYLKI